MKGALSVVETFSYREGELFTTYTDSAHFIILSETLNGFIGLPVWKNSKWVAVCLGKFETQGAREEKETGRARGEVIKT